MYCCDMQKPFVNEIKIMNVFNLKKSVSQAISKWYGTPSYQTYYLQVYYFFDNVRPICSNSILQATFKYDKLFFNALSPSHAKSLPCNQRWRGMQCHTADNM